MKYYRFHFANNQLQILLNKSYIISTNKNDILVLKYITKVPVFGNLFILIILKTCQIPPSKIV